MNTTNRMQRPRLIYRVHLVLLIPALIAFIYFLVDLALHLRARRDGYGRRYPDSGDCRAGDCAADGGCRAAVHPPRAGKHRRGDPGAVGLRNSNDHQSAFQRLAARASGIQYRLCRGDLARLFFSVLVFS